MCVTVSVCLSVSVLSGPFNQTSLNRLKLQTSNLTCMFPATVRTWPLKIFFENGAWQRRRLSTDTKHVTLNDLEWLFYVKFYFAPRLPPNFCALNANSSIRLKLRTSNLTCVFPGTVRTWPLNFFRKGGICKNSLGELLVNTLLLFARWQHHHTITKETENSCPARLIILSVEDISTLEGGRLCFYLCLFICLSVCLLNYSEVGIGFYHFDEILWRDEAWPKDQSINFGGDSNQVPNIGFLHTDDHRISHHF